MILNDIIALQKARMSIYDEGSNNANDGVFYNFAENPSYRKILLGENSIGAHVIDGGVTNGVSYRTVIVRPPDTIGVGDYASMEKDNLWLCVTVDDLLYNKTRFAKCNKTIKWINKINTLIEKPAITSAQTLYTTGIKEEKIIQVPDGMMGIQFPYDDDTKQLNRGDAFVFNRSKYEITFYDETTYPGLLVLICKEESINDAYDDMENEIADRWDKDGKDRLDDKVGDPVDDEVSIVISGENEIFITEKATYTAIIHNNGVEVDEPVTFTLSNNLANFESRDGKRCIVRTNNSFNTGRVILTARLVSDETIFAEKEIRIVGM